MASFIVPDRVLKLMRIIRELAEVPFAESRGPFIVGGWPRDQIIGVDSKDVDIEVFDVSPERLRERLIGCCDSVDLVGASFGVFKVVFEGMEMDISMPRRESKQGRGTKGFMASADPFMSVKEAQARRDFTLNAIYFDPFKSEIIDNYGGIADISRKLLRATSPAFAEDPLRVLRGMQFAGRWGFAMHEDTVEMCKSLAGEFDTIPADRKKEEFEKLMSKGVDFHAAFKVLMQTGWITLFPELNAMHGCPQDPEWHPEGDALQHTICVMQAMHSVCKRQGIEGEERLIRMFAALTHDLGKPKTTAMSDKGRWASPRHAHVGVPIAKRFLLGIGIAHRIIDRVLPLVQEHMVHIKVTPNRKIVSNLARRLAPATIEQWSNVVEADVSGRPPLPAHNPVAHWVEMAADAGCVTAPMKPIIKGQHLIERGMTPSPLFGKIVEAGLQAQMSGVYKEMEGAQAWLTEHLKSIDTGALQQ